MSVDYYYYVFSSTPSVTDYVVNTLYEQLPLAHVAFYRNGTPRADRLGVHPSEFIKDIMDVADKHLKFIRFFVGAIGEEWNDHKVAVISDGHLVRILDIGNNFQRIAQEWYSH